MSNFQCNRREEKGYYSVLKMLLKVIHGAKPESSTRAIYFPQLEQTVEQ